MFQVGGRALPARLASTYPNLHCTYFPLSLSLSFCLYICGKGVSRKTKTDKQTAISSKPYDRPYNIRLYIGLYMYTNNLCATRAVLFRRHGVDVAPYLPRIATPLTRSIAFPTCKLFFKQGYHVSHCIHSRFLDCKSHWGNCACLARQANPFLKWSA